MKPGILLAVGLILLSGCAQIEAIFKRPAPPPERATPSTAPPAPPLRPQLSAEEEQRLREDATRKIGEADRLLRELEGRQMKPQQQEMFLTAKDFLDQARSALGARDYQRAVNLASKARALSDDLAALTK
ncbi:MAG: hypothetical protein HYY64_13895 [Candidatus Rokubacteria bacterium]|nr:hypothetical protein [Candidatus Rokubacteria bacterium]